MIFMYTQYDIIVIYIYIYNSYYHNHCNSYMFVIAYVASSRPRLTRRCLGCCCHIVLSIMAMIT